AALSGGLINKKKLKGNTALHIASLAGQTEVVKELVTNGANVNAQSQNGFTPLYMAAQENHLEVVRFLLENSASQSIATEDGFTPLAVALQQGHDQVVSLLLENDTKGKVRLPALHIAARKDDTKAAALLLQNDHNADVESKSGFTPLHIAAHYGNINVATLLLNRGAAVDFMARNDITPLHVAAKRGNSNMVKLLLDRGAKIDAKTKDGLTPLHCGARSGHEQVVEILLDRGAPILSKTKNGLSPLHMATQGDHLNCVQLLLQHDVPVDDVTNDYLTALHVAAHCGHYKVAKLIVDKKANPNAKALNGFTPLHIACKKNRVKVMELLLKHGASIQAVTEVIDVLIFHVDHQHRASLSITVSRRKQKGIQNWAKKSLPLSLQDDQTALHISSRLGKVDIVQQLLHCGASANAATTSGYTPLHLAAREGHHDVAAMLLDNGASLSSATKKGFSPLHVAAKYGKMEVASLLLQKGAAPDAAGKSGLTPLHVAAHYDNQRVALLLLDQGASPHAAAKNGYMPLHIAAKKNQMEIGTTLLEYGADTNAVTRQGISPIHLAAQEGNVDLVSLLLTKNANVNVCNKSGLTPLHLAAQEDKVNVAEVLLNHGADVNPQTKMGYTPLHVACHYGNAKMANFLLHNHARVNGKTKNGYTPLHQAAQQGHTHIINLLLQNGASANELTNGNTALSIARRLGYISVVDTLRPVTDENLSASEKHKINVPETMNEFLDMSDDEGITAKFQNSKHRFSPLYCPVSSSFSVFVTFCLFLHFILVYGDHSMGIVLLTCVRSFSLSFSFVVVLFPTLKCSSSSGRFLVSFMVDARGGSMRGSRHNGMRIIIPPRKCTAPTRITCRLAKRHKLAYPPPMVEGEGLVSRLVEVGPAGAQFLGPVIVEIPHFGSMRGKERELIVLRSDNGDTWKEHQSDTRPEDLTELLSGMDEELDSPAELEKKRICRIVTGDFPQYFAVVSRIKQESNHMGPDGGVLSSSTVPMVQASFPPGALTKKIRVGLQAQPVPDDMVRAVLGNRATFSPIVTVEPRRRKFHKPITMTIPVPPRSAEGHPSGHRGESAPCLRLLCSITGKMTVIGLFWLADCHQIPETVSLASQLYRELICVPYLAKFVVFAKMNDAVEARLRCFCMTDDKVDKTLEQQENFEEVARSKDIEVLEGKPIYVDCYGNLSPLAKSGQQLDVFFLSHSLLAFTVASFIQVHFRNNSPFLESALIISCSLIYMLAFCVSTELAREMNFTVDEINHIRLENPNSLTAQSFMLLKKWVSREGKNATSKIIFLCLYVFLFTYSCFCFHSFSVMLEEEDRSFQEMEPIHRPRSRSFPTMCELDVDMAYSTSSPSLSSISSITPSSPERAQIGDGRVQLDPFNGVKQDVCLKRGEKEVTEELGKVVEVAAAELEEGSALVEKWVERDLIENVERKCEMITKDRSKLTEENTILVEQKEGSEEEEKDLVSNQRDHIHDGNKGTAYVMEEVRDVQLSNEQYDLPGNEHEMEKACDTFEADSRKVDGDTEKVFCEGLFFSLGVLFQCGDGERLFLIVCEVLRKLASFYSHANHKYQQGEEAKNIPGETMTEEHYMDQDGNLISRKVIRKVIRRVSTPTPENQGGDRWHKDLHHSPTLQEDASEVA
uniref:Ankyrin 3 n=1 Tax=Oreochromis niloticus TaxID=8128 RepID=A0A669DBR1_ORENI